jgi:hypothetical protein
VSSALAIAAVTACLKDLLNDGLLNHDLSAMGSFTVTSTAPDRITTGATEPNQLNLFLYQVTPNTGWRNEGYPSRDTKGGRINNPPLALDLHYLLTAYGSADFHSEILLGYAMQLLHETPIITRNQLRTVLNPSPLDAVILPPAFQSLPAADLADQVEQIKISPVYLNTEELSKMWTAMQARYRTTMAYMVSVVLIQSAASVKSAPPVLKQGKDDSGPVALAAPFPTITNVRAAISSLLPSIRLGDDLIVTGTQLNTSSNLAIQFSNDKAGIANTIAPVSVQSGTQMTAHLPSIAQDANAMSNWAAGLYIVALVVTQPGIPTFTTSGTAVAFSPLITVSPLAAAAGDLVLTITCTPRILNDQKAQLRLVFGSQTFVADTIATPVDLTEPTTLTFTVPGVVAGEYLVRLRIDGIDSLPVLFQGTPQQMVFDPAQKVKVT